MTPSFSRLIQANLHLKQRKPMQRKTANPTAYHSSAKAIVLPLLVALTGYSQAQTTANAGIASAPTVGTAASGSTAGTFLDVTQTASWSAGKPDINTEAIFSGGFLGTTAAFSTLKLTLGNNTNLYGSSYQTGATTGAQTITVGSGGITTGSTTDSRIGPNLTLAVGSNNQSWTVPTARTLTIQGLVSGSATITLDGAGSLSKTDGLSSGFTGIWNVTNGTFLALNRFGIGGDSARVALSNNAELRLTANLTEFNRNLSIGTGGGTLSTSSNGAIFSGAISGSNPLTIARSANNVAFTINSDMTTHVGSVSISRGFTGATVSFGSGTDPAVNRAKFSFNLGSNGIVDGVDTSSGSASSLIRGGTGANAVTVNFTNTLFTINRQRVDLANGNHWRLVDMSNLNVVYGENFSVSGFTKASPGIWTLADGGSTWTFSESTGVLSLTYTGIPQNFITTTGTTFDMSLGTTWDNGVIPQNTVTEEYIAVFDVANNSSNVQTDYTAPNGSVFNWKGMAFDVAGVELDPALGSNITINLGSGGIVGVATRIGNPLNGVITLAVGANNQTWTPQSANGVAAKITGSATISFDSAGINWLRGDNTGFSGKWVIPSTGTLRTADSKSIGGSTASVELATNATVTFTGFLSTQSHEAVVTLSGTSGNLDTQAGLTTTMNGPISGGSTSSPASLTLKSSSGSASAMNLHGSLANHVGAWIVNRSNAGGFTLTLGNEATDEFSFIIGANKIVDGVNTTSVPLISAGTGSSTSSVVFNNQLTIDTSAASTDDGNSWNLIDKTNLTVSTGANFNVKDFTDKGDGTWTKTGGGNIWTLNMNTGVLSVTSGGDDFSTWIVGTFANGTIPDGQRGMNDDPDGDGISNLIEYAVAGLDPTISNGSLGTRTGNSISFDKRQPLATDISYTIETSTDLGGSVPWTTAEAVSSDTTISYTLPEGPAKNFMRLKVTKP
jgi:hypothetical protein